MNVGGRSRRILEITERGHDVIDEVLPRAVGVNVRLLAGVSEEDFQVFARVIERIVANASGE